MVLALPWPQSNQDRFCSFQLFHFVLLRIGQQSRSLYAFFYGDCARMMDSTNAGISLTSSERFSVNLTSLARPKLRSLPMMQPSAAHTLQERENIFSLQRTRSDI